MPQTLRLTDPYAISLYALADAMLAAAIASPVPLLYEAYPSRRWFIAAEIYDCRGYAGVAYSPTDPRCRSAIVADMLAGWTLETSEDIRQIASE